MKRILRYLGRYFLQGLLYIVPISVTVYILMEGFIFLDSLIPLDIPGMGILSVLITITLIGFVGSPYVNIELNGTIKLSFLGIALPIPFI